MDKSEAKEEKDGSASLNETEVVHAASEDESDPEVIPMNESDAVVPGKIRKSIEAFDQVPLLSRIRQNTHLIYAICCILPTPYTYLFMKGTGPSGFLWFFFSVHLATYFFLREEQMRRVLSWLCPWVMVSSGPLEAFHE